jgi:hypothetical protein
VRRPSVEDVWLALGYAVWFGLIYGIWQIVARMTR